MGLAHQSQQGQIVATDGGQGYKSNTQARSTMEKVISGRYQGLIKELD